MIRIKISNHEEVAHASTGPFTRFFAKMLSAMSLLDLKRAVDKKVLKRLTAALTELGFDTVGSRECPAGEEEDTYITLRISNAEEVIGRRLEEELEAAGVHVSLDIVACDTSAKEPPSTGLSDDSPTKERQAEPD